MDHILSQPAFPRELSMAAQLSGLWLTSPAVTLTGKLLHRRGSRSSSATLSAVHPSTSSPTIEIVGGKNLGWNGMESSKLSSTLDIDPEEFDWVELEADLYHWTKALRPVQWYPGHIAKTEKELKDQLKLMDVVIEVRDARIPMSTSHPQMDSRLGNRKRIIVLNREDMITTADRNAWASYYARQLSYFALGKKQDAFVCSILWNYSTLYLNATNHANPWRKRIIVLNREDMITTADRNAWASYYARQGTKVVFSNGQLGMGTMKLTRLAKELAGGVNIKRKSKGLLPRPVRAGIVGYPNVGKSSLINRLLKRRMCPAAPRPGVTRELKWVRFGKDLELLDSPGVIPMRINDQSAAIKLAICDDIGERSYDVSEVAAILVQILSRLPAVGNKALHRRYRIETDGQGGKIFVQKLARQLFNGDTHQAAFRILSDFRKGKFGWVALERPPNSEVV